MPDFVIETADPLDWPGMLCLLQTANLHHIPSPEMPGLALETTFVARNGEGLAGIGGYKMTCPNAAKTTLLAVHPNYLSSPIGQQLQERRMRPLSVRRPMMAKSRSHFSKMLRASSSRPGCSTISMNFEIVVQAPHHLPLIDCLLNRTFGPDRFGKTVYRLREQAEAVPALSKVALGDNGELLASLRFWPIDIEGTPAILLGPLAVEPSLQGRGVGRALVRRGLSRGKALGYDLCVVVGEPEYYQPFGFIEAMEGAGSRQSQTLCAASHSIWRT